MSGIKFHCCDNKEAKNLAEIAKKFGWNWTFIGSTETYRLAVLACYQSGPGFSVSACDSPNDVASRAVHYREFLEAIIAGPEAFKRSAKVEVTLCENCVAHIASDGTTKIVAGTGVNAAQILIPNGGMESLVSQWNEMVH